MYWGWNGAKYTTSNLHLKGSDYDFTIHKMRARDRQSRVSLEYLNPTTITIPQYDFRIGYFIKDNWSVSFGFDHMKYVMVQNQTARLTGRIDNPNSGYRGALNDELQLTSEFLTFEHTDGLNNLNLETRYHKHLKHWGLSRSGRGIDLSVQCGGGAGLVVPKTNAQLFMQERHDQFHISGFDGHAVAGAQLDILNHFFIASEMKGGYINMPSILTTYSSTDKASQSFGYFQYNILFGFQFNLARK